MIMSETFFCLDETINILGVTPNRVAVEAKISPNTIYNMIENKTTRIHKNTITSLLDAINDIATEKGINKRFTIADILTYER
ncbi:XRE family transcriptional regulator [Peribacillus muralis]|uniref:XRE family transcriptional regulator n=1 Tax=Peribacillus muralis TaxID=264697 RepID=UPI003D008F81